MRELDEGDAADAKEEGGGAEGARRGRRPGRRGPAPKAKLSEPGDKRPALAHILSSARFPEQRWEDGGVTQGYHFRVDRTRRWLKLTMFCALLAETVAELSPGSADAAELAARAATLMAFVQEHTAVDLSGDDATAMARAVAAAARSAPRRPRGVDAGRPARSHPPTSAKALRPWSRMLLIACACDAIAARANSGDRLADVILARASQRPDLPSLCFSHPVGLVEAFGGPSLLPAFTDPTAPVGAADEVAVRCVMHRGVSPVDCAAAAFRPASVVDCLSSFLPSDLRSCAFRGSGFARSGHLPSPSLLLFLACLRPDALASAEDFTSDTEPTLASLSGGVRFSTLLRTEAAQMRDWELARAVRREHIGRSLGGEGKKSFPSVGATVRGLRVAASRLGALADAANQIARGRRAKSAAIEVLAAQVAIERLCGILEEDARVPARGVVASDAHAVVEERFAPDASDRERAVARITGREVALCGAPPSHEATPTPTNPSSAPASHATSLSACEEAPRKPTVGLSRLPEARTGIV